MKKLRTFLAAITLTVFSAVQVSATTGIDALDTVLRMLSDFIMVPAFQDPTVQLAIVRFGIFMIVFAAGNMGLKRAQLERKVAGIVSFVVAFIGAFLMPESMVAGTQGSLAAIFSLIFPIAIFAGALYYGFLKLRGDGDSKTAPLMHFFGLVLIILALMILNTYGIATGVLPSSGQTSSISGEDITLSIVQTALEWMIFFLSVAAIIKAFLTIGSLFSGMSFKRPNWSNPFKRKKNTEEEDDDSAEDDEPTEDTGRGSIEGRVIQREKYDEARSGKGNPDKELTNLSNDWGVETDITLESYDGSNWKPYRESTSGSDGSFKFEDLDLEKYYRVKATHGGSEFYNLRSDDNYIFLGQNIRNYKGVLVLVEQTEKGPIGEVEKHGAISGRVIKGEEVADFEEDYDSLFDRETDYGIPNVPVVLVDGDGKQVESFSVRSDKNGFFKFSNVPLGKALYTIALYPGDDRPKENGNKYGNTGGEDPKIVLSEEERKFAGALIPIFPYGKSEGEKTPLVVPAVDKSKAKKRAKNKSPNRSGFRTEGKVTVTSPQEWEKISDAFMVFTHGGYKELFPCLFFYDFQTNRAVKLPYAINKAKHGDEVWPLLQCNEIKAGNGDIVGVKVDDKASIKRGKFQLYCLLFKSEEAWKKARSSWDYVFEKILAAEKGKREDVAALDNLMYDFDFIDIEVGSGSSNGELEKALQYLSSAKSIGIPDGQPLVFQVQDYGEKVQELREYLEMVRDQAEVSEELTNKINDVIENFKTIEEFCLGSTQDGPSEQERDNAIGQDMFQGYYVKNASANIAEKVKEELGR